MRDKRTPKDVCGEASIYCETFSPLEYLDSARFVMLIGVFALIEMNSGKI